MKPFRPRIEIEASLDKEDRRSVVATLHIAVCETLILRHYEVEGPQCEHVTSSQTDFKEIDKLIAQMKRVARKLKIPIKINGDEIAALIQTLDP
jgi:hypothetical protein